MSTDPRIDAFIAKKADFARPILEHLRRLIHEACPKIEETIKWGTPAFYLNGRPLANMAAFKAHAAFGFWQHDQVTDGQERNADAMGTFGRITSVADLPPEAELKALIVRAAALIDQGVKPARAKTVKPAIEMPEDFAVALAGDAAARTAYDAFPPGARRDYLEWITEAKRPETRQKRIGEAVSWIAEGKRRNWKYESC